MSEDNPCCQTVTQHEQPHLSSRCEGQEINHGERRTEKHSQWLRTRDFVAPHLLATRRINHAVKPATFAAVCRSGIAHSSHVQKARRDPGDSFSIPHRDLHPATSPCYVMELSRVHRRLSHATIIPNHASTKWKRASSPTFTRRQWHSR
jgi:hypothetical protein